MAMLSYCLKHQLIVFMTWWDLKSSGGARPVCIPMPECPPATVAERHEGTVKPFLSNKGVLAGTDISLIKDDKIVTDDHDLYEIFNDYYINIVENTSGKKLSSIANANSIDDDREIVRLILDKYKDHQSILAIVQNPEHTFQCFSFNEIFHFSFSFYHCLQHTRSFQQINILLTLFL